MKTATTKPLTLHPHQIRRLLDTGKVTLWRVVKPQPALIEGKTWVWPEDGRACKVSWGVNVNPNLQDAVSRHAPHVPGSRCWVRETWGLVCTEPFKKIIPNFPAGMCLSGDADLLWRDNTPMATVFRADGEPAISMYWRQANHMPQWASRLTVTISRVTVQRVGDVVSNAAFKQLWNQHNRKHQFADNPWAWCYEVEKV